MFRVIVQQPLMKLSLTSSKMRVSLCEQNASFQRVLNRSVEVSRRGILRSGRATFAVGPDLAKAKVHDLWEIVRNEVVGTDLPPPFLWR